MSKSLLVNCYLNSTKVSGLLEVLENYSQCLPVQYGSIDQDFQFDKDVDSVIISGSEARIVEPSDRLKFEGVVGLIKKCNLPIFGICFGHQLLCSTFGAKTGRLRQRVFDCFEEVRVVQTDDLFVGFKVGQTIPLSEYHNDYITKEGLDGAGFVLLADSDSCEVEAVKHKTKPFYGVQFHPERVDLNGELHLEGNKIIENFYKQVVKR